jgi:nucleoside-triphosphatase
MIQKESKVFIVTGPIQVGKTYFCTFLISQAQAKGLHLAGVICPPIFTNGQKTAIAIEDLKSRCRKTLAVIRTTETEGVFTDRWAFDDEVLTWGNQVLADTRGCDLLLVDELGPLEFIRGEGWQNGLHAIDEGEYKTAVVVIRPGLVETAQKRWPDAQLLEIPGSMNQDQANNLVEIILHSS